jgi:hypothetical protein
VFQLLIFLTVGLILLVFVVAVALRGKAEGGAEALVEAQQALDSLQSELLAPDITARIFTKHDLDFVRSLSVPRIEKFFLRDRKKVALIWVGRVHERICLLRRLHLGSARYYARLSVKTELELAFDFAMLLVSCRALQLTFVVGGPYAAPGMVRAVTEVAARVCGVSKQSLAFLTGPDAGIFPPSQSEGSLRS